MSSVFGRLRTTVAALATAGLLAVTVITAPATAATQVTATAGVNVRSGPSTSTRIIGGLYRGQTVTAISSANGWTKIQFGAGTAYVASRYVTTKRTDGCATVTGSSVTTTGVNFRTGPGLSYRILRVIREGTSVSLTGLSARGFAGVRIGNDCGWISNQYLARSRNALPAVTGTRVAQADLAIRTGSGSDARVVGEIKKGQRVSVTGTTQNGRAQIIYGQAVRWVTARYLSNTAANRPTLPSLPATIGTRYATAELNLWTGPTGSAQVDAVPRGTGLRITGREQSGRAQVVYRNVVRWVTARYLSTTPPTDPPPSTGGGGSVPSSWTTTERRLTAQTIKVHRAARAAFPQIKVVYGWREASSGEHPAGRALDLMIPNYRTAEGRQLGTELANWARQNAPGLRIHYVIWRQQIFNVQRAGEGWRFMADRGDDSSNHLNHVHISVLP